MGKKSKRRREAPAVSEKMYGKNLSFAASEAYKLLRTNLLFALPEQQKCRVVGITSAGSGEGKSTTSLNLAYILAEADKRVLLIEGDMRLPVISKRLKLKAAPGLSNVLAGMCTEKEAIQACSIQENLWLMASGDIPPNPSEMLGSVQMREMLDCLSDQFDFILLDLPPVNVVADALVVSQLTHGVIVVVRQDYATRRGVEEAMRQMQYAGAKVLGFVMTCSDAQGKSKKKYGYGYKYSYGYESAKKKAER